MTLQSQNEKELRAITDGALERQKQLDLDRMRSQAEKDGRKLLEEARKAAAKGYDRYEVPGYATMQKPYQYVLVAHINQELGLRTKQDYEEDPEDYGGDNNFPNRREVLYILW